MTRNNNRSTRRSIPEDPMMEKMIADQLEKNRELKEERRQLLEERKALLEQLQNQKRKYLNLIVR